MDQEEVMEDRQAEAWEGERAHTRKRSPFGTPARNARQIQDCANTKRT